MAAGGRRRRIFVVTLHPAHQIAARAFIPPHGRDVEQLVGDEILLGAAAIARIGVIDVAGIIARELDQQRFSLVARHSCAYRKSNPAILTVQSAQDWMADNASGCLGGA